MSSIIETSKTEPGVNSTAYLKIKTVKCNSPRARFDVIFYPHYIQLIQFNSNKDVIICHSINKSDVKEMYRLPVDKQQMLIVLHLSHSIIGRIKMSYHFIVFTFLKNEYLKTKLDSTDSPITNLFRREIVCDGVISGKTMHIFEKMLKYVFDKPVIVPVHQNISTSVIKCTFADDIDHYLYPLRDRFLSVWRYCQCLKLTEVMYVKFVKREGRAKTFDFTIYPSLNNIDNEISKSVKCWYFEFKFIDQKHYDWLYEYCTNNGIKHKCDSDETSGTDSDSGDDNTGNLRDIIAGVDYEAPDPHMSRCNLEGESVDSSNNEQKIDRHLRNITTAPNQSRCKKVKYRDGSESTSDKDADDQASPNTDSSSDYNSGEKSNVNLRKKITDVNYEVPDPYLSRCKREGKYRSSLESTNEQESDSSPNYNSVEKNNVNLRRAIADVNYEVPDPYLSRCKREGKYRSSLESTNEQESDSSPNYNSVEKNNVNLRRAIADVNYEVPDPYLSRCKREGKYRSSLESTNEQESDSSPNYNSVEKNNVNLRRAIADVNYEVPDPYLSRCKREGKYRSSLESTRDEEADDEVSQQSDCSSDLSETIVDVKYEAPDPYLSRCEREGKYRSSFEYTSEQESDSSSNDNSSEKSDVNLSKTIVDINYEVPDPYLSRCKKEGKYRSSLESRKKAKTANQGCSFSGPNSVVKLRCRKRVIFDEENVDDRSICDSFVKKEKK